ncbi:MAG: hypothetical protein WBG86_12375 [Polyangiales bacterium]
MPSHNDVPELARVLWRAAQEVTRDDSVWLDQGLPQSLRDAIQATVELSQASIAFVEVTGVSPTGTALQRRSQRPACPVVGLSIAPLEELDDLIREHDESGISVRRLICPFAVFDFGANGPIVREVQPGLTAADLQERLATPLWAGPDLRALESRS